MTRLIVYEEKSKKIIEQKKVYYSSGTLLFVILAVICAWLSTKNQFFISLTVLMAMLTMMYSTTYDYWSLVLRLDKGLKP